MVYGEVSCSCRVYQTRLEDGQRAYVYLLDDAMQVAKIGQWVLNGDGGSWIRDVYDLEVIFQLDCYHIYPEILRKIKDKEMQQAIRELFDGKDMDGMLEYVQCYADS